MQFSRYLKRFSCEGSPLHYLLYSTRNASKIRLKKEYFDFIEENGGLPLTSELNVLSKFGMLVENIEDEQRSVLGFYDHLNAINTSLNIIAVLNLDCNLSCRYCYEADRKGKHYMSDETAEGLIHFVKQHFTADKKTLLIDFYGGEPLLSLGLIKYISRILKSFCEMKGADYSFTLVTNGTLFSRSIAEELVPLGLKSVKITIDGPAEVHNLNRPFKTGAASFECIIRNIRDTCDLVKIGMGGNFEETNFTQFPMLLDYLLANTLTPDKIATIKFDPVMKQPQENIIKDRCLGGCVSVNEPWVSSAASRLREEILMRGYSTIPITPIMCMIESKHSFVVNYNGVIYKCPGLIGIKGFEAGDIREGIRDYSSIYHLDKWKNKECTECEYLPLCFGGCRYMAYLRNGNLNIPDCRKAHFDSSLEVLVKQDIKYNIRADK